MNRLRSFAPTWRESWRSMNQAYRDDVTENGGDMDGCETNLYVYADGSWTIDGAQYLTDHRNIVSVVGICPVNGPVELAELIENEFDDSCCDDESGTE